MSPVDRFCAVSGGGGLFRSDRRSNHLDYHAIRVENRGQIFLVATKFMCKTGNVCSV